MRSIGVHIAHPDPGIVDELIHAVEGEGDLYVALDPAKASVALAGRAALEDATAQFSGGAIVGLATNGDLAEVSRAALRCRAQEIVCWPQDRSALRKILRDAASRARLDARRADGRIVAVAGARGGAGTTTVAAMLARAMEAVVVDLEPVGAAQSAFQADDAEPTLGTVLAAIDDLDAQALSAALTPHASGVALCGSPRAASVSGAQASKLTALVRSAAGVAVFDLGRASDDATSAVAREAETRVIICSPDVASMLGARALLELGDAHVVLNGAAWGRVSVREAGRVLGRKPIAVPADRRVRRAGEAGRLPKRGRARKAIDDLGRRLLAEARDGS
jgi:Flp pilus assembly CpaE family ATPase